MYKIYINKDIELTTEEIEKIIKEKFENLKELEKVAKGSNYIKELSEIAFLQIELNQFEESEKNLLICLKHFKKQLDRLGQAAVYGVLGVLFFKKGEYEKSIENYKMAYEIYRELNQVQEQITCLKGIGNNYLKLRDLDEACDNFLECSAICSDHDDIYNLLDCLGNLIFIQETLEKWDVVFELYKKTLQAFEELKDPKGQITSLFNLGILKKKLQHYEEAILFFKKGTNIAIESNYTELILKGLSYIGESLFYQGKIKAAKNEFIKALHLATKTNAKNAVFQLKMLIHSLGLSEKDIEKDLIEYESKSNFKK